VDTTNRQTRLFLSTVSPILLRRLSITLLTVTPWCNIAAISNRMAVDSRRWPKFIISCPMWWQQYFTETVPSTTLVVAEMSAVQDETSWLLPDAFNNSSNQVIFIKLITNDVKPGGSVLPKGSFYVPWPCGSVSLPCLSLWGFSLGPVPCLTKCCSVDCTEWILIMISITMTPFDIHLIAFVGIDI